MRVRASVRILGLGLVPLLLPLTRTLIHAAAHRACARASVKPLDRRRGGLRHAVRLSLPEVRGEVAPAAEGWRAAARQDPLASAEGALVRAAQHQGVCDACGQ